MSTQLYCLILHLLCHMFSFKICTSQMFDHEYTGIAFSPYVKDKTNESDEYPPWSTYNSNEIRVMLHIILEKFSRIVTWNSGSKNVPYKQNFTYYNDSYAYVQTAEIAASINRERGSKRITMIQGLWQEYESPQIETEIQLAIECAEKANKIYAGTVEGILLLHKVIATKYEAAKQTLKSLEVLKNLSVRELKIGTAMECSKLYTNYAGESTSERQEEVVKRILLATDFVICTIDSLSHIKNNGERGSFQSNTKKLLEFRKNLQKYNPNIKVMGALNWANLGFQKLDTIDKQKICWETLSMWAKQNELPIWIYEAFDNPRIGTNGWWRLSDNSKSELREGYIEKISEFKFSKTTIPMSIGVIVCIVLGISVLIFLSAVIIILNIRGKKQRQISNEDVREFMEGMSEENTRQQGSDYVDIPGQTSPYDSSMEIDKNQLKIGYNNKSNSIKLNTRNLLGTGQFGRVFKAVIKKHEKEIEDVALKIPKQNCSRSTLKELLSEIKVMTYIGNHINIVTLRGVYTAELQNGIVYIATELCSLGSLLSYLRQQEKMLRLNRTYINLEAASADQSNPVSRQEMLKWCHEIACGMEYLGTKNVVHADLAARNVLLTGEKVAKISDFGLSRRMYNYSNYVKSKKGPLPWRWMAIESLKRGEFSAKSDVWSYGITLWEIFSLGEMPFSGLVWAPSFVKMLIDGTRLDRPTYATPELYDIMTDCWQNRSDDRPEFTKICKKVMDMIDQNITNAKIIC